VDATTSAGTPPQAAPATPSVVGRLGPYRLLQVIGGGGMGVVHLGLDPAGRAVAIKVLRPHVAAAVAPHFTVEVVLLQGQIGSGSLPVERLPSAGLALTPAGTARKGMGRLLDALATALRALPRPVLGRIADDRLLLDLRCLEAHDRAAFMAQIDLLRQRLG